MCVCVCEGCVGVCVCVRLCCDCVCEGCVIIVCVRYVGIVHVCVYRRIVVLVCVCLCVHGNCIG